MSIPAAERSGYRRPVGRRRSGALPVQCTLVAPASFRRAPTQAERRSRAGAIACIRRFGALLNPHLCFKVPCYCFAGTSEVPLNSLYSAGLLFPSVPIGHCETASFLVIADHISLERWRLAGCRKHDRSAILVLPSRQGW